MKDPNNKILFDIVNNTAQDQVINLFDNGDPTSGGKFTGGSDRIIQYDLSSYSFPNTVPTGVIVNYNSAEYPINEGQYFAIGALSDMATLLTYLNSLGIGSFTDQGSGIVNSHPNYPLVDDNGGLYGVELTIEQVYNVNWDLQIINGASPVSGPTTGTTNYKVNDLVDNSLDLTENLTPGQQFTGSGTSVIYIPNNKQVLVSGTAIDYWLFTISLNGSPIQTFGPNSPGPINITSTPFTVSQSDSLVLNMQTYFP